MSVSTLVKSTLAALALTGAVAAVAPAAQAGTDVDFYLNVGADPGYYGGGYGFYGPDVVIDPGFHHPRRHHWRISCGEGREQVRWAGFRKVQTIECDGRSYTYKARKHGDWYEVRVSARNGDILSVREYF